MLIDSSNFDCSLIVSIDHFADNFLGVFHHNFFGDLKLLGLLQTKEENKPFSFVIGFLT